MEKDEEDLGGLGERLAARHLKKLGYRILARNFDSGSGEADIIAEESGEIVFVEVKTRRDIRKGTPLDAVTRAKRRRLAGAAKSFLKLKHLADRPARFDVVGVRVAPGGAPQEIELVKNAFTLSDL